MKKTLLVIALILGFVSRSFEFKERFNYNHDNDLASWIVKDIFIDHHVRLIGQLTSSPGIFIGGLYYYLIIPFYLATQMDPIGSVAFSWIVGILAISSIYYVFRKLYNPFSGNVAAIVYAVSYSLSFTDRQVVPTTAVMLWCIWFFYAISNWLKGDKRSLWLLATLFALIWHLHLALGLLFPLLFLRKFKIRDCIGPLILFLVLSAPLLVFEARHNFQQTHALFGTFGKLGQHTTENSSLIGKLHKTIKYTARNANGIFFTVEPSEPWLYILPISLLTALFVYKADTRFRLAYCLWIVLYILFFSLHPIGLSEYYLAGLNILFIAGFVLLAHKAWGLGTLAKLVVCFGIAIFVAHNFGVMFTSGGLGSGYIQKKALVLEIKNDAAKHGYPCVSISYITKIGDNFGYRYLFYLAGLHVNPPSRLSPVYSIVFPQSMVDRVDTSFGALGLIYPDYSRYNSEEIAAACAGPDPNIAGSMFGFVK